MSALQIAVSFALKLSSPLIMTAVFTNCVSNMFEHLRIQASRATRGRPKVLCTFMIRNVTDHSMFEGSEFI